jgi:uncharacterized protein YlxW (UPF0749 family)
MNKVFAKQRVNGESKREQEKLNVLVNDFEKLEETRKENIRDLVQKLADIHCGAELTCKSKIGSVCA